MSALVTVDRGLGLKLADNAATNGSGIVTGMRGKLKRLFCMERGRLVHAASNVIEEQLPETLEAWGLLPKELVREAKKRAVAEGLALDQALVGTGKITADALAKAAEDHVRNLLFATLAWSEGDSRFERGVPDLRAELRVDLCPARLLGDYARQQPVGELRPRIGPPAARPKLRREHETLLERFEPDAAARYFLGQCDGSRTLEQIVDTSPAAKEASWRAIYALILIGTIELELGQPGRVARRDGVVTRSEVEARLERASAADAYSVLEMSPACSRDEIREAYYFLARRYHPDRFRAGPLRDMLPQIETFFAQVTEAYNTLFDPEQRKAFDQQRGAPAPVRPEVVQDTRYLARQNYVRARALIDKGRRAEAVQYLENAIQLDESRADYHYELGRLLAGNPRRRAEAERSLVRANELDPALADGYLARGELYVRLGRRDEAIEMFREVLRWEAGHIQATARLDELGAARARG